MKCYVIKNEEGKYKQPFLYMGEFYTDSLASAEMWPEREIAEYFCPSDCKVVEVTIAEGDLEKQLEQKRRKRMKKKTDSSLKTQEFKHNLDNIKFGLSVLMALIKKGEKE